MNHQFSLSQLFLSYILVLFFLAQSADAHANCNGVNTGSIDPTFKTKIIIGYIPKIPDFTFENNGFDAMAFPDQLPTELPAKDKIAKIIQGDAIDVSYWEKDGKGRLRACRIERWFPPRDDKPLDAKQKGELLSQQYILRYSLIVHLPPGHAIVYAAMIFYDKQGRIERVSETNFLLPDSPVEDIGCRRYDQQHRLLMSIRPVMTKRCPVGEPDLRDSWLEYRYGDVVDGRPAIVLRKMHGGGPDGNWHEEWSPFIIGSNREDPHGHANVSSEKGVTLIYGSTLGKLDNNSANTVLNSYGQSTGTTYTFTRAPVPIEVLQNANALYKYERRRQTIIDGSEKMFELFPPNGHFSPHRYYMMYGLVLRHEQLNNDGSVKRLITLQNYTQPRPGPKPAVNDKLLSQKGKLWHQVFHRVYEVDRAGKPKLVAMSWNERRRLTPRDDVPVDYAHLVYGTPDGKRRWKTKADFEKAFDTSSRAAHVYPDYKPDPKTTAIRID